MYCGCFDVVIYFVLDIVLDNVLVVFLEVFLEVVLEVVVECPGGKLSLKIFLMLSLMFFLMLSLMLYFMLSLMIVTSLVWLTLLTYMKSQPYMMPRTGLKVSVVVVVRL